ncbi:MAG: restriction endonuclease subunit S [Selenomonas sp.]|nr:restriction endonuclease subunit S [Selenomonas sp.]
MIYKIGELCDVYDGPHATPKETENGPVYLGIKAITEQGRIDSSQFKYLSNEDYIKWTKRVTPQSNDIVFSYEATLGRYAIIPDGFHGCLGRRLAIVRVRDNKKLNYKYLYYYFLSPIWKAFISNNTVSGSTVDRISIDEFPNYEIEVPEIKIQNMIVSILDAVDTKIDINIKTINTLESMAKTLYDYWFVQFDFPDANGRPYKTRGGKMEWNETLSREIPAGWEVDNLFRIASYVNGLACQKYRPQGNEESLPVIKIREMHEGVRTDTERVSANIPLDNVICDGDILFSWSATLEIQYWTGGKAGLNQHIFKVIPSEDIPKEYVYHQLKEYIVNFVKIAEARKTTMGHITQDHLKFSRIVIPPYEVLRRFEERMKPIHKQMVKCNQENRKLIYLRDFLLPMLMNGQVTFRQ